MGFKPDLLTPIEGVLIKENLMLKTATLVVFAVTLSGLCFAQQDKSKRPSPPAQAQCTLADGKTITVDYSSPRLKGRKVGGEVAPFGEIWRTGANEATTFVTTANLSAEGTDVPAGSYTIFTLPEQDKWTLIISKVTGEWGIPYKDDYKSKELGRVPMQVSKTASPVENFTISFDQSGGCTLQLSWGDTQASVKFTEK
ncbi:MAG: DUF2911 domain-containing protein [Acidobacteria bacterium]|nr:DUF2911 domain-containing protein [Acidobacteriota bacterium]